MKFYHYQCNWCFFSIDDDKQRITDHCLKVHGVTGKFKKGFKTRVRHRRKTMEEIKPIEEIKPTETPEGIRYKRHYLRGTAAPEGAKVFISKNDKEYILKEIGKKKGYIS